MKFLSLLALCSLLCSLSAWSQAHPSFADVLSAAKTNREFFGGFSLSWGGDGGEQSRIICARYGMPLLTDERARQAVKLGEQEPSMPDQKPPRYLAIDVGTKRIGVAVSDELGLTAQPVLTLGRRRSPREDLRSLARLCRRFGVSGIVVGNPLRLDGQISPQTARVQALARELGELSGLPIHLWDERLTTHEAHQLLYESGRSRPTHRHVVDQVAATLILQSFLDEQARTTT